MRGAGGAEGQPSASNPRLSRMANEVAAPETTPQQYRERAKLIRSQAEAVTNADTRARLLKIAEEFDSLADSIVSSRRGG